MMQALLTYAHSFQQLLLSMIGDERSTFRAFENSLLSTLSECMGSNVEKNNLIHFESRNEIRQGKPRDTDELSESRK